MTRLAPLLQDLRHDLRKGLHQGLRQDLRKGCQVVSGVKKPAKRPVRLGQAKAWMGRRLPYSQAVPTPTAPITRQ